MSPSTVLMTQKGTRLRDRLGLPGKSALLFIPVVTLLLFALFFFVIIGGPITVDGPSMYPTLHDGDRVYVVKYRFGSTPERGDIVSVDGPAVDPEPLIKRVFAVGGDTITCEDGYLVVEGQEPYSSSHCIGPWPDEMVVPADTIFVVGDNEGNSTDSRMFGPLPVENVSGKASFIFWPLSRIQRL